MQENRERDQMLKISGHDGGKVTPRTSRSAVARRNDQIDQQNTTKKQQTRLRLTYLEAWVAAQVQGGERGVGGHAEAHLLEVLTVQLVACRCREEGEVTKWKYR